MHSSLLRWAGPLGQTSEADPLPQGLGKSLNLFAITPCAWPSVPVHLSHPDMEQGARSDSARSPPWAVSFPWREANREAHHKSLPGSWLRKCPVTNGGRHLGPLCGWSGHQQNLAASSLRSLERQSPGSWKEFLLSAVAGPASALFQQGAQHQKPLAEHACFQGRPQPPAAPGRFVCCNSVSASPHLCPHAPSPFLGGCK